MERTLKRSLNAAFMSILALLCLMLPMRAEATEVDSGTWGDNLTWILNNEGTLTISGIGRMNHEYNEDYPWENYKDSIKSIVIDNGVTSIANSAFWKCSNLAYVSLPETLLVLSVSSFEDCTSLLEITLPDSVEEMYYPFTDSGLQTIHIGKNAETLDGAFFGCDYLKTITVSDKNQTYCAVDGVVFSKDKKTLYCYPAGKTDTNYTVPNTVAEIESGAFRNNAYLTTVTLPETVENIEDSTFISCSKLATISLPEGLYSIGDNAFSSSGLVEIVIPKSVWYINDEAFAYCKQLKTIRFQGGYPQIADNAFSKITATAHYRIGYDGWPNSAMTDLPNYGGTITWTGYEHIHNFDDNYKCECDAAGGICGGDMTWLLEDGTLTISGTGSMSQFPYTEAPWHTYKDQIEYIHIENGVESISDFAFALLTNLRGVVIPLSVNSIGRGAFLPGYVYVDFLYDGCEHQWSNIGGDDVLKDGGYLSCSENENKYDEDHTTEFVCSVCGLEIEPGIPHDYKHGVCTICGMEDPDYTIVDFGDCGDNLTWTFEENGTLTISGTGDMADCSVYPYVPWSYYEEAILEVVVEDGASSISKNSFAGCENLRTVKIPNSVTRIGDFAFGDCVSLTLDKIPESITEIGKGAFIGCASLEAITIPGSVISIGDAAFENCGNLKAVTILEGTEVIGNGSFAGCYSLENVAISNSVTGIEASAFYGCASLEEIEIPGSVSSIADSAFEDCTSLVFVTILEGVTDIGDRAFYDCYPLKSITIPDGVTHIGSNAFSFCNLEEIRFTGSAPNINDVAFYCVNATVYYPANNETWTDTVKQNYGGTITWVPYTTEHSHEYDDHHKCECGIIGGSCGNNLTWIFDEETGILTISGEGSMANYSTASNQPWYDYRKQLTELVIEDGVTSVGNCAFDGCTSLETINWGGINSIGNYAFYNCDGLTGSLTIPDSITRIGLKAFYDCDGLDGNLLIPNGVTSMDSGAFVSCDGIDSLTIGCGLKSIPYGAFTDCSSLKTIDFCSVTSIGENAFWGCSHLTEASFPESITSIEAYSFGNCFDLSTIHFSGDAPTIGSHAFQAVTATAYYPAKNATWFEEVRQDYGGIITWAVMGGEENYIKHMELNGSADTTPVLVGGTASVNVVYSPRNAMKDFTFTISDSSILAHKKNYHSSNGFAFECLKEGTAAVTITEKYTGKSVTREITVVSPKVVSELPFAETVAVPDANHKVFYTFTPTETGIYTVYRNLDMSKRGASICIEPSNGGIPIATGSTECSALLEANITYTLEIPFTECSGTETDVIRIEKSSATEEQILFFSEETISTTIRALYESSSCYTQIYYLGSGTLSWESSNSDVAEFSSMFNNRAWFTCKQAGTATITVTDGTFSDSIIIEVKEYPYLQLNEPMAVPAEQSGNIFAFTAPADGRYTITMDGGESPLKCRLEIVSQQVESYTFTEYTSTILKKLKKDEIFEFMMVGVDEPGAKQDVTLIVTKVNDTLPVSMHLMPTVYRNNDYLLFGAGFTPTNYSEAIVGWEVSDRNIIGERQATPAGRHAFDIYTNGEVTVTATSESGRNASCTLVVGTCGENMSWYLKDGVLTIFGSGAMNDFTDRGPWNNWQNRLSTATVNNSITSIGSLAFADCDKLNSITFMGNAPNIAADAFTGITAYGYYPAGDPTWSEDVMQNYGGNITWKPYSSDNHAEVVDKAVSPTCTEAGLTEGKHCSVCGKILVEQKTVPAKGHSYGTPIFTWDDNFSCTAVFTCKNCDSRQSVTCTVTSLSSGNPVQIVYTAKAELNGRTYTDTKTVTADSPEHTAHTAGSQWFSDNDSHWKQCTNCEEKMDISAHIPSAEATKNTSQKCSVCGHVLRTPKDLDWFFDKLNDPDSYLWASGYYAKIMEQYG